MKPLAKNILLSFLLLLLISGLFGGVFQSDLLNKPEEISLSRLVTEIESTNVSSITIQESDLEVELNDGTKLIARKEDQESITSTLTNLGVSPDALRIIDIEQQSPSGGTIFLVNVLPILLPILLIGFFIWFMLRSAQRGQSQAFTFGKSRAKLHVQQKGKKKVTFKDVGGLETVKEELEEIVEFLKTPKKFHAIGAKIPRGVLLVGGPGTGKTLIARAVANEAGVPFFHISGSEFVEMFVGVGASRVRSTFQMAKKHAPSILFVDELDAIGRHRGAGLGGGHDEREQTLNQILVEMDGFDKTASVIVMAATNRPDILDPALLRPGRFDRKVTFDNPDIKGRQSTLVIHAKNKPLAKGVDLKSIAERTPGFSGADLENLLNEAAILAARDDRKTITQDDIVDSIDKVMIGSARKTHLLSKEEKKITAYHEAGHALVAASLKDADPVHKISIVSRGQAAGYTLKLPTEDRHLMSRSQFIADIAVMLGGFIAEKLTFKELTTGASNDLERATNLARALVTRYGMSDALGPIVYGKREETVFLGKEIHEHRNYSEKVAQKIDEEVSNIISYAYKLGEKALTSHKKVLENISQKLLKQEVIEREEFEKMVKGLKPMAA